MTVSAPPLSSSLKRASRHRRGATLTELLVSCIIFAFIVAAVGRLYSGGEKQQQMGRTYGTAQTDLRYTLRRMTRAIRHGRTVVPSVTGGNLNGKASGPNSLIVTVPQAGNSADINIYFYKTSDGTLYYWKSVESGPGTALMRGVQTLAFNYYITTRSTSGSSSTGTTTTALTSNLGSATEVQIIVTATNGPTTTTAQSYIALRNTSWMLQ